MEDRKEKQLIDFYGPPMRSRQYSSKECREQLLQDFPWIYCNDITRVLSFQHDQYAKAHKSLSYIMAVLDKVDPIPPDATDLSRTKRARDATKVRVEVYNDDRMSYPFMINRMKRKREEININVSKMEAELFEEVKFVRMRRRQSLELGEGSSSSSTQPSESMIECACCFGDVDFGRMAQCAEGHLVCVECLVTYTKEKVFGTSKLTLDCMAEDCTATYPQSELARCLPVEIHERWDECFMEDSLKTANIPDFVRCPYCNYGAITSPISKSFMCQRENCHQLTCKSCGADWADHQGKSCSEMEKRDEMALRKKFEEDMTKSTVRTCPKCGFEFVKEDGCNKMMCRCGATMCYVCRKPNISYNHFCQHFREPGFPCKVCTECSLWTSTEDDEKMAIRELRKEANDKRKEMGYEDDKLIGAPEEKKIKIM